MRAHSHFAINMAIWLSTEPAYEMRNKESGALCPCKRPVLEGWQAGGRRALGAASHGRNYRLILQIISPSPPGLLEVPFPSSNL